MRSSTFIAAAIRSGVDRSFLKHVWRFGAVEGGKCKDERRRGEKGSAFRQQPMQPLRNGGMRFAFPPYIFGSRRRPGPSDSIAEGWIPACAGIRIDHSAAAGCRDTFANSAPRKRARAVIAERPARASASGL